VLTQTFLHFYRIRSATECRLWTAWCARLGSRPWLDCPPSSGRVPAVLGGGLKESQRGSRQEGLRYFASRLATKHLWRLYPAFQPNVAFTGHRDNRPDFHGDEITTVVLYEEADPHLCARPEPQRPRRRPRPYQLSGHLQPAGALTSLSLKRNSPACGSTRPTSI